MPASGMSWAARAALVAIRAYQASLAPLLPLPCRFHPSCSHYAAGAIARFGFAVGVRLASARLLRCRPFGPGGYDPVPESRAASDPVMHLPEEPAR
jgi:putative membrane protein insertion efficiency factor